MSKLFGCTSPALQAINKAGLTQIRLRFTKDDDNDRTADYLSLYSGSGGAGMEPTLYVYYNP